ncbi:uncharacterized protein LOC144157615 [Haemaphysalis longicornis]
MPPAQPSGIRTTASSKGSMAVDEKPVDADAKRELTGRITKKPTRKHVERIALRNGTAWTAGNIKMFFVDSEQGNQRAFYFNFGKGDASAMLRKLPPPLLPTRSFGTTWCQGPLAIGFTLLGPDELRSQPGVGAT